MKLLDVLKREIARKADYRGVKPEQVARAVVKYRRAAKDEPGLSCIDQATGRRSRPLTLVDNPLS